MNKTDALLLESNKKNNKHLKREEAKKESLLNIYNTNIILTEKKNLKKFFNKKKNLRNLKQKKVKLLNLYIKL